MFIIQLIAAAIILLIETFNKIEFFKPSIYYHFRQVSSLDTFINKLIGVEMENSLVYQLKNTFWGNTNEDLCIYINYVIQAKYEYLHRMDSSILTHLTSNSIDQSDGIYISVIDSQNFLSVYAVDSNQFLDENHYSFNRQLSFIQTLLIKLDGKLQKLEECENKFKYMIHMQDLTNDDIYYVVNLKEKKVLKFTEVLHSNSQMIYYFDLDHNILIINKNSNKQYIGSINSVNEITQPMKLFHRGRYLHNISIQNQYQNQLQNQEQIIHLISIIVDEHNGQVKLFIIYYQMSVSTGHGSSIILFQEDITKIVFNYLTQMTQYYKLNLQELVNYAQYQDQVYLIIANKNHYYIRPIIQTNDRLQIQKILIKKYRNYNDSNKIRKMVLFNKHLIIEQYDYFTEGNNIFYVNLSTIQQYHDDQYVSLSKIEDYYQNLDKIIIQDILLYQQPNQIEMIIILETGDLVIGSLQQPIYVWLYDYVFGSDNQMDDISKLRQDTTFWIILTVILIFLKIYPYLSI